MSANGMVRPCSCPTGEQSWNGAAIEGARPCPTRPPIRSPSSASMSARTRSISSASTSGARLSCGRNGRAVRLKLGLQTPPCLIGMEACVGAHHLSRKLNSLGHDARLMPAKYVRPYSKGQKNDFRDAEAVQRPTMKFVATKAAEQLDLQALHRVRERLVSQRTAVINQIRAFLLERGVAVRQGQRFLRAALPKLLAAPSEALSPRMARTIEELAGDWRRLAKADARIYQISWNAYRQSPAIGGQRAAASGAVRGTLPRHPLTMPGRRKAAFAPKRLARSLGARRIVDRPAQRGVHRKPVAHATTRACRTSMTSFVSARRTARRFGLLR